MHIMYSVRSSPKHEGSKEPPGSEIFGSPPKNWSYHIQHLWQSSKSNPIYFKNFYPTKWCSFRYWQVTLNSVSHEHLADVDDHDGQLVGTNKPVVPKSSWLYGMLKGFFFMTHKPTKCSHMFPWIYWQWTFNLWHYSKNPCHCGNRTFPNEVHH